MSETYLAPAIRPELLQRNRIATGVQDMITVINSRHSHGNCYRSIGGIGGYSYQPETTTVEWSDGTRLIVEDYTATAIYRGQAYPLPQFSTLHDVIVEHWTAAIDRRLQRDLEPTTRLRDRVQNWRTEWPDSAA